MTDGKPDETKEIIQKEAIAPASAPASTADGGNGIGEVKAMCEKMLAMMSQLTGSTTTKAAETIPTPAPVDVQKIDIAAMVQKAVEEKFKILTEGKPAATPRPDIQKKDGIEVPKNLGRASVDELWAQIEPKEERPW